MATLRVLAAAAVLTAATAQAQLPMQFPPSLQPGDTIAIITPSSSQYTETIQQAIEALKDWGLVAEPLHHAMGKNYGSYAAEPELRAADLTEAFANPRYKAVLCARGGYGAVQVIPQIDRRVIAHNPKWLIGFSDITAVHALMRTAGVASIHGPMTSQLAKEGTSDPSLQAMHRILFEGLPAEATAPPAPYDHYGTATGRLVGGNLAVLNGLAQTPYDMLGAMAQEPCILFIEDVGERIYAVERMLMRLHLSGLLQQARGLVFGQFTEYTPDENFSSMESMIYTWLCRWGYYDRPGFPIAFKFPVGHVTDNAPLVVGSEATLTVGDHGATLTMRAD